MLYTSLDLACMQTSVLRHSVARNLLVYFNNVQNYTLSFGAKLTSMQKKLKIFKTKFEISFNL